MQGRRQAIRRGRIRRQHHLLNHLPQRLTRLMADVGLVQALFQRRYLAPVNLRRLRMQLHRRRRLGKRRQLRRQRGFLRLQRRKPAAQRVIPELDPMMRTMDLGN